MHDTRRVRALDRGQHAGHDLARFVHGKRSALGDVAAEVGSVDQFHHDVRAGTAPSPCRFLAVVVDRDDVRVVRRRERFRLALDAPATRLVVRRRAREELHRDVASEAAVVGLPDLGHAARADELDQLVPVVEHAFAAQGAPLIQPPHTAVRTQDGSGLGLSAAGLHARAGPPSCSRRRSPHGRSGRVCGACDHDAAALVDPDVVDRVAPEHEVPRRELRTSTRAAGRRTAPGTSAAATRRRAPTPTSSGPSSRRSPALRRPSGTACRSATPLRGRPPLRSLGPAPGT